MKDFFLGLDLGGTNIHTGLVTKNGVIKKEVFIPTEACKGRKAVLENIMRAIEPVMGFKPKGRGIGAPNYDSGLGKITKCVNIPLDNFDIIGFMEKKFNLKVKVSNDADCFA